MDTQGLHEKSLTKAFIILKQYCESQKGVLEKVKIYAFQ